MDIVVHVEELKNKEENTRENIFFSNGSTVYVSFCYLGNSCKVEFDCQINSQGNKQIWVYLM